MEIRAPSGFTVFRFILRMKNGRAIMDENVPNQHRGMKSGVRPPDSCLVNRKIKLIAAQVLLTPFCKRWFKLFSVGHLCKEKRNQKKRPDFLSDLIHGVISCSKTSAQYCFIVWLVWSSWCEITGPILILSPESLHSLVLSFRTLANIGCFNGLWKNKKECLLFVY